MRESCREAHRWNRARTPSPTAPTTSVAALPQLTSSPLAASRAARQHTLVQGRFDQFLTAVIPAKDLRTHLRLRGVRNASDETKAVILRAFIGRELRDQQLRSQLAPRSDVTAWFTSREQGWVTSRER
jgi:hypothetical protein